MKKPNIKLMNSVHTEARITKQSSILKIIHDVNSMEYLSYRMIESIRMAQHDPDNAESHLCLVAQLCTIARTMIREDLFRIDLPEKKQGPVTPLMCGAENPDHDTLCILPENHGMKHMDAFNRYWNSSPFEDVVDGNGNLQTTPPLLRR
jgi:hypothetical protein